MHIGKKILPGILIIGFALLINACVVVVKENPNGHTRTHTSSSLQYWYYYPDSQVYYHITEHYYYYPDHGRWIKVRRLPEGWVLNSNYRVRLKITGKPYVWHAKHKRRYPVKNISRRDRAENYPGNREHYDSDKNHPRPGEHPEQNAERHNEHGQHESHHANRQDEHGNSRNREHGKIDKNIPPGLDRAAEAHERAQQHKQQQAEKHPQRKDHLNRGREQSVAKNPQNNSPNNSRNNLRNEPHGKLQNANAQHPGKNGHPRNHPENGKTSISQQGKPHAAPGNDMNRGKEHGQKRNTPHNDIASMKGRETPAKQEKASQKTEDHPNAAPNQQHAAKDKRQSPAMLDKNRGSSPATETQHADKPHKRDNNQTETARDKHQDAKGSNKKAASAGKKVKGKGKGKGKDKGNKEEGDDAEQQQSDDEIAEAGSDSGNGNGKGKGRKN